MNVIKRIKTYQCIGPEAVTNDILRKCDIVMFTDFEMSEPEICSIEDGEVYISDFYSGIVEHSRAGFYVRKFHGSTRNIGIFKGCLNLISEEEETNECD